MRYLKTFIVCLAVSTSALAQTTLSAIEEENLKLIETSLRVKDDGDPFKDPVVKPDEFPGLSLQIDIKNTELLVAVRTAWSAVYAYAFLTAENWVEEKESWKSILNLYDKQNIVNAREEESSLWTSIQNLFSAGKTASEEIHNLLKQRADKQLTALSKVDTKNIYHGRLYSAAHYREYILNRDNASVN